MALRLGSESPAPPAPGAGIAAELRRLGAGVRLTPTQRRVLAHLVEHAVELPWLSAVELATQAGVSQPSVTRLANVLGFDGWAALRARLRGRAAGPPLPTPPGDRDRPADPLAGLLATEAGVLASMASTLPSPGERRDLGRCLRASRPLVVSGFRAGAYLASYAAYLARKVHPEVVEVLHGGPDATDRLVAARASGATAALVVCMPRYPGETIRLLGEACRLGYQVALVTDEAMPGVDGVDVRWRVAVPVTTGLTFDAHPAALVALGVVLDALCDADPAVTEARLEALDEAAAAAGTYWAG